MRTLPIMCVAVACLLASQPFASESTQVTQPKEIKTKNNTTATPLSLHQQFAPYFDIGTAINTKQAVNSHPPANRVINQHFNSLTPENDMKWERIQPIENSFTFDNADALIEYAETNGQHVIGHVLVWHSQTPDWVFEDEHGQPASRELLLSRMKKHIFALAGRYKGKIKGWDVVNEALNEDGSMRESKWYGIIGDDFIDKAFEYAHQAAPDTELYYNDYNLFKPEKMDGAIRIAKRLRQKGLRIDGIGLQAHYGLPPPVQALEKSIEKVADAGLKAMITELDISVLKFPDEEKMGADVSLSFELQDEYNPYAKGLSPQTEQKLAHAYIDLFSLFTKHSDKVSRVTLWGVSDADTWRNNWPMNGRTDYPLLFDRQYQAKPFLKDILLQSEQATRR